MNKALYNNMLIGSNGLSVLEAMQKIDKNAKGILVLVNDDLRLVGTLTDGDIRRFLLSGGVLSDNCMRAANCHPRVAYSLEEAHQLYHQVNYVAIPIVDITNVVVDVYVGERAKRDFPRLSIPVVINAGGKGTRLDPYTRVLPKPLIPVGDIPIIEHIMDLFTKYGCDEFHIIVNYKKQLIKAYFSENEKNYNITWHDEEQPLGTGGGLALLKGKLCQTFFFTNCDTLIQTNYKSLLQYHKENHDLVTMVCSHKNITLPYGVIEMGEKGKIDGYKEKPLLSFLINTGLYLVEPEVVEDMEENAPIGFPDVVEAIRRKNDAVSVFPISENDWMDMGQLDELEKMRNRLFKEEN